MAISPRSKSRLATVGPAASPHRNPSTAPSQTIAAWSPRPVATAASCDASKAGRSTTSAAGKRIRRHGDRPTTSADGVYASAGDSEGE